MKKLKIKLCFLGIVIAVFLISGCAVRSPVGGGFYTNTKGPVASGGPIKYSKI